jgi:CheY-like chemotaxis protein
MGGDMRLNSVVGQGTTFSFDVQVQVADASDFVLPEPVRRVVGLEPGQRPTDGSLTGDGRYRILIVDDIRTNRQLVVKLLYPLGFDLREAENGQEAIEIWESWKPHLIWMDMRMPVMDGYEATQWIRTQSSPDQRSVIVAVTASVFEEDRTAVISIGCDDIITKPFRESEIMRMLHKHLDVRFQYEDEPGDQAAIPEATLEGLTIHGLADLPSDLFASLKVSVAALDMDEALNVVEKIRTHDEGLANAIKMLVKEYRFDKLLEILERENEG